MHKPETIAPITQISPAASSNPILPMQCKLSIGAANDPLEQEADAMADKIMRMPETVPVNSFGDEGKSIQRKCAHCEEEEDELQRKPLAGSITPFIQAKSNDGGTASENITRQINETRGGGSPMDGSTQTFMATRFGTDFSDVKIHTGEYAVQMNREINAQAFTVGKDIYFNSGKYRPDSENGKHLLAHELTHTVQQRKGIAKKIQRFEASERSQISNINDIIVQATTFANNATWIGGLVEQAGGSTASGVTRGVFSADPSNAGALTHRYLITCRCGMIDMRHFYQLMYIASVATNRRATEAGRSHELNAEATSRFAAEDTTSNALGAFFGANNFNFFHTSVNTFITRLQAFLNRCSPVDFTSLPVAEQNAIVAFYSGRDSAGVPSNQSESAVPFIASIASCGGVSRSFPFAIDTGDPNRKTISSAAFDSGVSSLTSDSSIRDFINTQRTEIIRGLTTAEKVTLITRLLSGWVSDEDVNAVVAICRQAQDPSQLISIHRQIEPLLSDMSSEAQKDRVHRALMGS
ncbi:MAG: hypothetical protein JWP81_1798 [Ferruginibacter sp.]|nr:hypothetical protein [Ferruginibacter sp.]